MARMRSWAICGLALGLAVSGCAPVTPKDEAVLVPAAFSDLPGWQQDNPAAALSALARSCGVHLRRPRDRAVGPAAVGGLESDWQAPCRALAGIDPARIAPDDARAFIERHFRPFAVIGKDGAEGLFTGYYEPELNGSRTRSARYDVPLYARPADLLSADLGDFSEEFEGRTIAGKVVGNRFVPYDDRTAIMDGVLKGRDLELLWVDDPVDAFFLEIQGSGRVRMSDGSIVRLGYAGKNGRPYTAIGRVLIEKGEIARENVSMQSIRAWLAANPQRRNEIFRTNRSYVFFRELTGDGPLGAEGVALTPDRSLAVDRKFLPLGVPVFLSATDAAGAVKSLNRLMVAQDTGGAIRGAVRGDVFMGAGDAAAEAAGRMKMTGRYWLLLPRDAAARRNGA